MDGRNKEEITLDLREIFTIIYDKIWIILCVAVLGFVLAFGYTKFCIPYQYTSYVSMYVKNATNKAAVDIVNSSDMTASQELAATCIAILQEDVVTDEVGDMLLQNYTVDELMPYFVIEENGDGTYKIMTSSVLSKLYYSTVNETELIRVTATCGDPVIAADMCNYVAEIAPDILVRVVGAGAVEAVGVAKVPIYPSAPNAAKNAVIGFLAGFILAFGFFVFRYLIDNTIKSGDDAVQRFNLPLIGEIPFYEFGNQNKSKNKNTNKILARLGLKKNTEESDRERQTMLDVDVPFAVQEAYNTMRNNMMFSLSTEKKNVFVVSSPLPSEGKSTSTANLCISIGETDSRVLLVDADLRKPVQHKMFNLTNKQGLSTVLAGMCSFDRAVHKKVHHNLDVLTAGPVPPNPSQMLAAENMVNFINSASELYDYVVIDTSPINVVSDALVFAKQTAGLILVTRQDITTYDQVEKAVSSTEMFDVNLLGIVVNSVAASGGKYGRYGKYGYKYGYGKYGYKYGYGNEGTGQKK